MASFDAHAMLAQLFAENGEHEEAAVHARSGLENYPEPLPDMSGSALSIFNFVSRFSQKLREAPPNEAIKRVEEDRAKWFDWAKNYLKWYGLTYGDKFDPMNH